MNGLLTYSVISRVFCRRTFRRFWAAERIWPRCALIASLSAIVSSCSNPGWTCVGWGCCSYDLSFVTQRYFGELADDENILSRGDGYRFTRSDGLASVYNDQIDIVQNYSFVRVHNEGDEEIDLILDNYLLVDGEELRPSKASQMNFSPCQEPPCPPDPERPVPTPIILAPGQTETLYYEFPSKIANYHEVMQRITVGPEPDDLIISRHLTLSDRKYNCLFGNGGHYWRPVEDEPAWKPFDR